MINPYEFDESDPDTEAEHFSPCACLNPNCQLDDRDQSNMRLGGEWFTYDCALKNSTLMAQCVLDAIAREGDRK